jgi:hypothetical protein
VAEGPGPAEVATGWGSLGGRLASSAAAASWGTHETQIFAIRDDGQVWDRYWDGESWHDWKPHGGTFAAGPAACARDADRIDVFAVGTDGVLMHRRWDGGEQRWRPWRPVEGAPRGGTGVGCSWAAGRLDVFLRGPADELWYSALETSE